MNEVILSNKQIEMLYKILNTYPTWRKTIKISEKENDNVEDKLNKYLEENNIPVNDNGEFVMYVVVDADDKDHEIGAIIYKENTEAYTEDRAYEDLKNNTYATGGLADYFTFKLPKVSLSQTKRTTIREDLLRMEDKMLAVVVNKKDVSDAVNDIAYINKYRVLYSIDLNPILKYKIKSIDDERIQITLYNNLTGKSQLIILKNNSISSLEEIKVAIHNYLTNDEIQVELANSTIDDGIEL